MFIRIFLHSGDSPSIESQKKEIHRARKATKSMIALSSRSVSRIEILRGYAVYLDLATPDKVLASVQAADISGTDGTNCTSHWLCPSAVYLPFLIVATLRE